MNIQNSLDKVSKMLKEPIFMEVYRLEDFWEVNKELVFNFDKYDFMRSIGAEEPEECFELYELEDAFIECLDTSIENDEEGWLEFYKEYLAKEEKANK